MFNCEICGNTFISSSGLIRHVIFKHKVSKKVYFRRYNLFPKCSYCNNDVKITKRGYFNKTCGDKKCLNLSLSSVEKSKKLSISLKLAHKEGRANNWAKNWTPDKRSYPEKFFIDNIISKLNDQKYIEQYQLGKYAVDFVWEHKRLAIEVDGSQHYRFEEIILSDQKKEKLLFYNKFLLLRVNWVSLKNDVNKWISIVKEFVDNADEQQIKVAVRLNKVEIDWVLREEDRLNKFREKRISLKKNRKLSLDEIDFNKYGWVTKVAKIWGCSHTTVKRYIDKHFPEVLSDLSSSLGESC